MDDRGALLIIPPEWILWINKDILLSLESLASLMSLLSLFGEVMSKADRGLLEIMGGKKGKKRAFEGETAAPHRGILLFDIAISKGCCRAPLRNKEQDASADLRYPLYHKANYIAIILTLC